MFKASRGIEDIYELTYIRKDGSRFPAVVSVTALRDAHDAIIGYLLIGTDNTARKQVEAEQKKLDQRLRDQQFYTRSLIESNIDALMTTDPAGIITDVNKQMEALTGCTRDELIGAPFKNYFTDPERAEAGIKLVLSEKKVTDYELTARARDGKKTVVSYNATTFYDRDRKLQGVFAAARDVTERKRFELELQETNVELESAKSAAEKANLAKSDFLSSMSHELRSPLNAILGFAQLMESTSPMPTPSQKGSIAQILQAGWYLLELINEILDLAVIESGKLSLSLEPVSLAEVMSECQAMIEPQAQQRGIRMTFPQCDIPFHVDADRTRLKQVLINLLSNAIKYNRERGTVEVSCAVTSPERIRISVRDTGAGLPPEKLAQLFQPFNRLGQEASAEEGTGIGLVVSKRLVELMGGVIGVESTVGVGSVFWFELLLIPAPTPAAASAESDGRRSGTRADRRAAAHLALCRGQPGEPEAGRATDRAAVRHAPADRGERQSRHRAGARLAAGRDPDGHQSARHQRYRGDENPARRSGHGAHPDRRPERQCDAARHQEGPGGGIFPLSHQADQGQRVHGHAGRGAGVRRRRRSGPARAPRSAMINAADILNGQILIVDDQEANVLLLERMLGGAGYVSVASTTNPGEVCELHRSNHYDLILLDLQMPGMDGFQVMEALKEVENDGYLPVLVITAAARSQAARAAKRREGLHQQAVRSGGGVDAGPQHARSPPAARGGTRLTARRRNPSRSPTR